VSTNLSYTNGPFYAAVAYERHEKVNRQSDITAIYGTAVLPDAFAQGLSVRCKHPGLDHLGIQVENCDELQEVYAGRRQNHRTGANKVLLCGIGKSWIDDPAGIAGPS
jgi:predicted porin